MVHNTVTYNAFVVRMTLKQFQKKLTVLFVIYFLSILKLIADLMFPSFYGQ